MYRLKQIFDCKIRIFLPTLSKINPFSNFKSIALGSFNTPYSISPDGFFYKSAESLKKALKSLNKAFRSCRRVNVVMLCPDSKQLRCHRVRVVNDYGDMASV